MYSLVHCKHSFNLHKRIEWSSQSYEIEAYQAAESLLPTSKCIYIRQ